MTKLTSVNKCAAQLIIFFTFWTFYGPAPNTQVHYPKKNIALMIDLEKLSFSGDGILALHQFLVELRKDTSIFFDYAAYTIIYKSDVQRF